MHVRLSSLAIAASLLSYGCLVAALSPQDIPSDTPLSSLLTSAQAHLSKGETNEALVYYDAAVSRDPTNYLTFFKRATTYLSLGRLVLATEDFNKVLSLKPGFEGAHVQLARIKTRSADWEGAREHYLAANKTPDSQELADLQEAKGAVQLAIAAEAAGDWESCVNNAGVAIMAANRAPSLREMRSRCRFQRGEIEEGMSDLHHILQMRPGDTSPHIKIAALTFYGLGDLQAGLAQTRKCLHSDPDSKLCKKLLKQQKAIDKTLTKVNKSFEKNQPMTGVKLLIQSSDDNGLIKDIELQVQEFRESGVIPPQASTALYTRVVEMACQGYYEMNSKKAATYCEDALKINPSSFYGLLWRAKDLVEKDEFDAAIRSLEEAAQAWPEKQGIVHPLLQKAQVALKRSKTKDYYKVLGVSHDADERQIKSAYRKLSKIHHPDKAAKQGITKEEAEKKMASVNEAYEVLSNPELRARFDRGDDPNDQTQGNPFQGSPFGGGQPFMFHQGGPGGQFKFQFGGGGGFPFG